MNNPDQESTDAAAFAARIRAARAFAGLQQSEVADALDVSTATLKRMESGQRTVSLDERYRIADLCGVPRPFMDDGFIDSGHTEALEDRLRKIERRLDELAGEAP
jgi:transcriptional regulator with XRE-family HTH domain